MIGRITNMYIKLKNKYFNLIIFLIKFLIK
jgi:hypothetical protein